MPNISSFGTQTDNAVVQGTVTDRQMIIPEVPPQGLMSVGPRVTPNFVKPREWNDKTTYHFFDAVRDNTGNAYVATKPVVPAGTPLADEDYWFLWADPDTRFDELNETVKTFDLRIKHNLDLASDKFATLTDLINADVKLNRIYYVNGRKESGIGNGFYIITNDATNGFDKVRCTNGLTARLQPTGYITPEQIEPLTDSDWADTLTYAINFANKNKLELIACGYYHTHKSIVFTPGNDYLYVDVEGTIDYDGTDYAVKIKNTHSTYRFNTVIANQGSGIAFDQTGNNYNDLVANNSLKFERIKALENGVGFIAGNHGVLDLEVECGILISAKNCYYSEGGTGSTVSAPSYASEIHVRGGRLYGKEFAINVMVGSGYECTGHTYSNLSAEGSTKLINLDAGTGTINTFTLENIRTAEIGANGMITAIGNVRECVFRFAHLFMIPWFDNQMTSDKNRGCYVYAPINMTGASYTGFNCAYYSGNNGLKLLNMQSMFQSNISETFNWDPNGTRAPIYYFSLAGNIDVSKFPYLTNNGIPLYFKNDKDITITNGEKTIFNGPNNDIGTYALLKTDNDIHVLKF